MEQTFLDHAIIYIIHIRLMRKLEEEIQENIDHIYLSISDREKWYEKFPGELSYLKDLMKLKLKWIKIKDELRCQMKQDFNVEILKNLTEDVTESPKFLPSQRKD